MALKVEVAGLGICRTATPYSVFIVCVQQEKFEAWAVYRRFNSFNLLRDQLLPTHPGIPPIPHFDADNLSYENLENCRAILDKWLQILASNSYILKMQSMYQFLCIDANMPPPYLDIHWRRSSNGSFDEMDMDDMFDKHSESVDEGDMQEDEGEEEDDGSDEEIDEMRLSCSTSDHHHVFNMDDHGGKNSPRKSKNRGAGGPSKPHKKRAASHHHYEDTETDAQDGLDIQSLSVAQEAEFIYKVDEGKAMVEANSSEKKKTINLDAFKIIKVIGKGSFGKVFLVRDKASSTLYALKVLKKDYIIRKNQVEHTKTERSVLGYAKHPFIVGLNMAFQTSDKLFFVLDYCSGGELFFHLGKVGRFTEERSKFYAAQIILALEYVHKLNVIYRDLKPENVLLDHLGNIRLTDFGLSKEGVKDDSSGANSFCGTPEYIAPEVLLRQGHGRAVDWWSLGALTYEMITGLPPFYSRNRETMFEKIMKAQLTFPPQITDVAKDLLSHLLVRDPKQRLGSGDNDADDIKAHPFFHDVNWVKLATGTMNPPWVPSVAGSLDTSQFDNEFTSMMPIVSPDVRDANFGSLDRAFEGFTFVDETAAQHMNKGGAASYKGKHAATGAQATLLNMKKR